MSNCNYGTDDPEKATIAFILAFTSSKTNETAVFATSGATGLFVRDSRPEVEAEGYEPLNGLVDGFVANGGKIWLCPACAKAKGVAQQDLIDGFEIAGFAASPRISTPASPFSPPTPKNAAFE